MYITLKGKQGIPVHYFLSEIMLSVMACRMFFLIRCYFNYSIYCDNYSKKLNQQYGFDSNMKYALKC